MTLADARLQAGQAQGSLDLLRDGDLGTAWSTLGPQSAEAWIEVALPRRRRLGRIELALGPYADGYGRSVQVWVAEPGGEWRREPVTQGRPPLDEQVPASIRSQVLILDPVETDRLRLVQKGRAEQAWTIAELWLDAFR